MPANRSHKRQIGDGEEKKNVLDLGNINLISELGRIGTSDHRTSIIKWAGKLRINLGEVFEDWFILVGVFDKVNVKKRRKINNKDSL